MRIHFFIFQFILMLGCSPLFGQVDTIKFQLTEHNNISIESIVNENDTINLMFHTAVNSVSLSPEKSNLLSENINKKSASAKGWTGTNDLEFIEDNKLAIANLEWNDLVIWLDMLSGPGTDGKFGPNLFDGKIVEIDFDQKQIVLYESQASMEGFKGYETFDLWTDENNALFIEGVLTINDIAIENKFLIHSGYGGTVILDHKFCKKNRSIKTLKVLEENDLKDSFGKIIKTKKVEADKFEICGVEFENVPLSYFDSDIEIQKTSVIGGAFLKRFNMILDLEEMEIHIKPNQYTTAVF